MDRLLNIDRQSGFPMCAETLRVLDENSMMLTALLDEIPLGRLQAMMFGRYMLVSDNMLRKRVVKVGTTTAPSLEWCNLEFHTVKHSVQDSNGNTFADVWGSETADITEVTNLRSIWRVFTFDEIFTPDPWQDRYAEFEAGLSGISFTAGGQFYRVDPLLQGSSNFFRSNKKRIQMRFDFLCKIKVNSFVAMDFPLPVACQDGACMTVNVNSFTGTEITSSYTAPAHTLNNNLRVEIGRGMADYGLILADAIHRVRDVLIRVNGEVLL